FGHDATDIDYYGWDTVPVRWTDGNCNWHGVDKKSKEAEEGEGLFDTQKRIKDIYLLGFQRLMEMVKKQVGQPAEMASVKSKKPTKRERKNVRIAKIEKLGYEMICVR
nr:hypothetical protein [Tanacetum cinerariifolium]